MTICYIAGSARRRNAERGLESKTKNCARGSRLLHKEKAQHETDEKCDRRIRQDVEKSVPDIV